MSGFKDCPKCGSNNIKPQTPAEDDMMVRRLYARCFDCGYKCKPIYLDKPLHWLEVGNLPIQQIYDLWNKSIKQVSGEQEG